MTAAGRYRSRGLRPERAAGPVTDAEIVVVGGGAAGLSLAWRLVTGTADAGSRSGRRTEDGRTPDVLLVEPPPGPARSPARTWCFWEEGPGEFDDLVTASWRRLSVTDGDGRSTSGTCASTYKMLRSADYTRRLRARLAESGRVRLVSGTARAAYDVPGGAEVAGVDGGGRPFRVRGGWVFDSRPPHRLPPARTTLLQHFRGWFLRTGRPRFDASAAQLMDFRTGQPDRGLAFFYLLPLAADAALVEYTVFSSTLLPADAYDSALRRYIEDTRGLGSYTVTGTEQGVIPMTDGRPPRRQGRSVLRIGGAGGATRPSTGYTFAALQRQTAGVAASLRAGRTPVPPDPHRLRHRAMDAVLLRALAEGRVDGARFFTELFRRNSLETVVRFLDGRSTAAEEWAIGLRTPVVPMLRTLAGLPFVPRRPGLFTPAMPVVPAPSECAPGGDACGTPGEAEPAEAREPGEDRR